MKKLKITVFTIGFLLLFSSVFFLNNTTAGIEGNPNKPATNVSSDVAVFYVSDPWGSTGVFDILNADGKSYDTFSHLDMGNVDLSGYSKVIIQSEQPLEFNDATSANRSYFENYVFNGGILEIHAATNSAWYGVLPGGFLYTHNLLDYVNITDYGHPVMNFPYLIDDSNTDINDIDGLNQDLDNWGSSVHGVLSGLMPTDTVILTAQASFGSPADPVLVERKYGSGTFIVSTQTLEYKWSEGTIEAMAPLENLVRYYPPTGGPIKIGIFRETYAWGKNANTKILDNLGIQHDILNTQDIGTVDLSSYRKIIIESEQPESFNNAILQNQAYFEAFVSNGGILQMNTATNSYWNHDTYGYLPGGYMYNPTYPELINIVDIPNPMLNVPFLITNDSLDLWGSSAHGILTGLTPQDNVVLTAFDGSLPGPVLVERQIGAGLLITSTQTLEHGWGNDYSLLLENIIAYGLPPQIRLPNYKPSLVSGPSDQWINEGEIYTPSWNFISEYPTTNWELYIDENLMYTAPWTNATGFSYNLGPFNIGIYDIKVKVYNNLNEFAVHIFKLNVPEYNSPVLVGAPSDFTMEYGSIGNMVFWNFTDQTPDHYDIYIDGNFQYTGMWQSGVQIEINLDGLSIGYHDVTINVFDIFYNMASDLVYIEVIDTNAPILTHPEDIEMDEGSLGFSIVWSVNDPDGGTWQVDLDNSFHSDGNFNEGNYEIVINLDGLSAGLHTFILNVFDYSGNYATDEVVVNVIEVEPPISSPPASTTPPESTTPPTSSNEPPTNGEPSSSQPSLPLPFSSNLVIGLTLFFVTVSIRMKRR